MNRMMDGRTEVVPCNVLGRTGLEWMGCEEGRNGLGLEGQHGAGSQRACGRGRIDGVEYGTGSGDGSPKVQGCANRAVWTGAADVRFWAVEFGTSWGLVRRTVEPGAVSLSEVFCPLLYNI